VDSRLVQNWAGRLPPPAVVRNGLLKLYSQANVPKIQVFLPALHWQVILEPASAVGLASVTPRAAMSAVVSAIESERIGAPYC
jgi:hypothetical protein